MQGQQQCPGGGVLGGILPQQLLGFPQLARRPTAAPALPRFSPGHMWRAGDPGPTPQSSSLPALWY